MLSLIPGAASASDLQVLVITDATGPPHVEARANYGSVSDVTVRALATSSVELQAELERRRLRFYHLRLGGLPASGDVSLSVAVGIGIKHLRLSTLPDRIPPEGISFIAASCYFDGFHHGAKLRAAMSEQYLGQPSVFQLWAGDNLYLDVPGFGLKSEPYKNTVQRYVDYFTGSQYQHARGLHAAFSTFDDHEFWNNFPESQIWLGRSSGSDRDPHIDAARECLSLFQSSVSPGPVAEGLSYRFELPPVSFFVADMRSHRTKRDGSNARMMTEGDLQALVDWAHSLKGAGVLVLGQPLWIQAGGGTDYNTPSFSKEYRAIWKALREAPYDVMVITGDVHHSRVLQFSFDNAPNRAVYEFCTSPVSHIPTELSLAVPILGYSQGRGKLDPPEYVENSGQHVKAKCLFGTTAPNSFGVLRLKPLTDGEVAVGGTFIDYIDKRGPADAETVRGIPALGRRQYLECKEPRMFTLRMR